MKSPPLRDRGALVTDFVWLPLAGGRVVHSPRRHIFLCEHRLPHVKVGDSPYSMPWSNFIWKWGSETVIQVKFLNLNDLSNFPLLHPKKVSICASDPLQCSSPSPPPFCVSVSWSAQTISGCVPLVLLLGLLSAFHSPKILK